MTEGSLYLSTQDGEALTTTSKRPFIFDTVCLGLKAELGEAVKHCAGLPYKSLSLFTDVAIQEWCIVGVLTRSFQSLAHGSVGSEVLNNHE